MIFCLNPFLTLQLSCPIGLQYKPFWQTEVLAVPILGVVPERFEDSARWLLIDCTSLGRRGRRSPEWLDCGRYASYR